MLMFITGWERAGGLAAPNSCPSPCSIPRPPKPVPMTGWVQRAAAHLAKASGFGKERARNCCQRPSTSTLQHGWGVPTTEQAPKPGWAVRSSCKGWEGKPKPRQEAQSCHVAELLKRTPVARPLQGMLPPVSRLAWGSGSPGGSIAHQGEAVPGCKDVSSNKSVHLAGGPVLKASKPLARGAPAGRSAVNWCITEVQGSWLLHQGWSTVLAPAERLPPARGADRPGPAPLSVCGSAGSQELMALCPGQMVRRQEAGKLWCGCNAQPPRSLTSKPQPPQQQATDGLSVILPRSKSNQTSSWLCFNG